MNKWKIGACSHHASGRVSELMSVLVGKRTYHRLIMPAIFAMIVGATQKWNGR